MCEQVAYAGNKGEKIRPDCHVTLRMKDSGGLQIDVDSKSLGFEGMGCIHRRYFC